MRQLTGVHYLARSGSSGPYAYGKLVVRRNRTLLVTLACFVALGIGINAFRPPVYVATVRLEIRRPPGRPPLTGGAIDNSSFQSEVVGMYTTTAFITNRALLGRLATELAGRGWIHEAGEHFGGLQSLIPFVRRGPTDALAGPGAGRPPNDPSRLAREIDWLERTIRVQPLRDTRLIDVRVEHTDPVAARTIADRLAQLFVDDQNRRAADADTSGLATLRARLAQLRERVDSSGGPIDADRQESFAFLQARVRQIEESIAKQSDAYLAVRNDRVVLDARLDRLQRLAPDTLAALALVPIESRTLDALRRDLLGCQTRLAAARGIYLDRHPRLIALEAEYAALRASARAELGRAVAGLRAERRVLAARESELGAALAENRRALSEANDRLQANAMAERDLETDRELYGSLLAKAEETWITRLSKPATVAIVDPAEVDPEPVRPRKVLNLLFSTAVGLLLGGGMTLLGRAGRQTIRAPEELETHLELPVLGVVPRRASMGGP
jgi:uncharacterized protein involved in exopolysaccharide biosynthesis